MSINVPVVHDTSANVWDWPLQPSDGEIKLVNDRTTFEVGLAVPHFAPNEIEVKVMNGDLIVHCRHEKRPYENSTVSREIHRTYKLPLDVDGATVRSHLANNGVLVISAKKKH